MDDRWVKEWEDVDFLREGNTGGSGPLSQGAMNLLTEVQSQASFFINPRFRIFTSPLDVSHARLTQEQTEYIDDPASGAVRGTENAFRVCRGTKRHCFLAVAKVSLDDGYRHQRRLNG